MNGGDIPLRAGWPQSAHRVPAMGPRPRWPLRPHSFPPLCSSWFCLVSSSTDPGHSLSVRVSGAHSQHPRVGIKKGSNPHSHLTPREVWHCYLGLLPCNHRLSFLYPDFYVSHFSFLPSEGLLITLLQAHCQCLSPGQETGLGDRSPRT